MMISYICISRDIIALHKAKHVEKRWASHLFKNTFNYKVFLSLNQLKHWEGQFMKITGGRHLKDIIQDRNKSKMLNDPCVQDDRTSACYIQTGLWKCCSVWNKRAFN